MSRPNISFGHYVRRNVGNETQESDILKKFLVHFRTPTEYRGEFGFDWMRDQYIYPILDVQGQKKEISLDIEKIKSEYKTIDVDKPITPYGKAYYPSFLNLLLGQEATLDIEIEEIDSLETNDDTRITFISSNSDLTISRSSAELKQLISGIKQTKTLDPNTTKNYYLARNVVKIKCNKPLIKNEQIKIFATKTDPNTGLELKKRNWQNDGNEE